MLHNHLESAVLIFCRQIGTVCVGVTSTKLWDLYLVVDAALQALVTAYDNGTTNFSDLAQLVPLKDRLGVLAAQQTQWVSGAFEI